MKCLHDVWNYIRTKTPFSKTQIPTSVSLSINFYFTAKILRVLIRETSIYLQKSSFYKIISLIKKISTLSVNIAQNKLGNKNFKYLLSYF